MDAIEILQELGLLSWSVIGCGLEKGWMTKKQVIDYAIKQVLNGENGNSCNIEIIAMGEDLNSHEFLNLVNSESKDGEEQFSLKSWRLAKLIIIDNSDKSDQEKIDMLQEVYSSFYYPEDMSSCSIYANDGIDPLVAMYNVIQNLKNSLMVNR